MNFSYDYLNRFITPKITLCNPDSVYVYNPDSVYDNGNITRSIGVIQNVKGYSIDYNFNSYSQGSFECDFSGDVIDGAFLFISKRRYIFIEHLGFCIITDCSEDKNGSVWTKKVTFCTCNKELENYESPMLVTDDTSMTLPLYSPYETTNDMVKTLNSILWNWTVQCDDSIKHYGEINEHNLPDEYQELPYICLNGSSYIDTGVSPTRYTSFTVEAELYGDTQADGCLLGCRGYSTNTRADDFVLWHNTVQLDSTEIIEWVNGKSWTVHNNISSSSFKKREIKLVYNHNDGNSYLYFYIDNVLIDSILYSDRHFDVAHSSYHIFLGALNHQGTMDKRGYRGKIYSCKIYDAVGSDHNSLIRYYIPCYRTNDRKIGLYDKVNSQFYESLSADFTYDNNLIYGTFTEQSSDNMFDFIYNDMQKQYDVVVDCNYINKVITLYLKNEYQNKYKTDVRISNNLYNTLTINDNLDNEYTSYNVSGDDDLMISNVNPIGNNTIYDFSKYKNASWMTDKLRSSLSEWENNTDKSKYIYRSVNKIKDQAFVNVSAKIQSYETELENAETNRQLFVNAYESLLSSSNEYTNADLLSFAERYQKNLFGGLNNLGHLPISIVPEKIWNEMFVELCRDVVFLEDDDGQSDYVYRYNTVTGLLEGTQEHGSILSILDSDDYTKNTVVNNQTVTLRLLDYYVLNETQNIVDQIMNDTELYGGKTVKEHLIDLWQYSEQTVTEDDISNYLKLILRAVKEYYIGCKPDKENIFFVLRAEFTDQTKLSPFNTDFRNTNSTEYIPLYPKGSYDNLNYAPNNKTANVFGSNDYHIYYVDKSLLRQYDSLIHTSGVVDGINEGKRLIEGYYWLFSLQDYHSAGAAGTADQVNNTKFFFDVYWEDLWNYYCMPYTGFKINIQDEIPYDNGLDNTHIYGKFFSRLTLNMEAGETDWFKFSFVGNNIYNIHYGLYHYGIPTDSDNLYNCDWYKAEEDVGNLGEPNLSNGKIGGHDFALHCWDRLLFYRFGVDTDSDAIKNSKLYLYAKYYYDKVPIQNYRYINSHHFRSATQYNWVTKIKTHDSTHTYTSNEKLNNYNAEILKATFWWNSTYWAKNVRQYETSIENIQVTNDWQTDTDYSIIKQQAKLTYAQMDRFTKAINTHCGFNEDAKPITNITSDTNNVTVDSDYGSLNIVLDNDTIWSNELLRQLICYINVGKYVNENITVNDSMTINEQYEQLITLMDKATESLSIASQGVLQFSIDNKSFIFDVAFAPYTAQLKPGCSVYIETSPNEYETVFLSSISINYSDKTISLTFGDKQAKFDIRSLFDEVLGDVSKSSLQIKKLAGRVKKLESKN